jgi:Ca-activated chloride channel family protein
MKMRRFWPLGLIFLAGCSRGHLEQQQPVAAATASPVTVVPAPMAVAKPRPLVASQNKQAVNQPVGQRPRPVNTYVPPTKGRGPHSSDVLPTYSSGDDGGLYSRRVVQPESSQPQFKGVEENKWKSPADAALSTFSIDVDTASYSLIRGFLKRHQLPPQEAVRVEEMVNYFPYEYARPGAGQPFAVHEELSDCPWDPKSYLLKIGIQGQQQPEYQIPPRNLVFLLDVSGSMSGPDRLGLVQKGMTRLTQQLGPKDHVAIVTYAGSSGVLLPPTSGEHKDKILDALAQLESGGSTNGEAGIRSAYDLAAKNFDKNGINRVILATDGDFNVGVSDQKQLVELIEKERKTGVFLTTLGVGAENINDHALEQLADKGNGNYSFLDSESEAEKVLVKEASGTLVTIAKDVKIQVEFNPQTVDQYRLLGYENRILAAQDFNDDTKDAGEVGSGHSVTAIYQLRPKRAGERPSVDPLRYQAPGNGEEIAQVKVRYQPPAGGKSQLLTQVVTRDQHVQLARASDDFRFAAAVTQFGMLLRGSKGMGHFGDVESLARAARGQDKDGYRSQFIEMVRIAAQLQGGQANSF